MSVLDRLMVIAVLVASLWWGLSRRRRPGALETLSAAALVLALATFVTEGVRWQLVLWQVLALAVGAAAGLRRWWPGHSRWWHRIIGRGALFVGLEVGGLALLMAIVPVLPTPSGPYRVGSVAFHWSEEVHTQALAANSSDRLQVIAQAWYPTDATSGRAVPYFAAQSHVSTGGLPSFFFASFGSILTHATVAPPASRAQQRWPVLLFAPAYPREEYTALCVELASRGYVVVAISSADDSIAGLAAGRIVEQTTRRDVMGPLPHDWLERLVDTRTADSRFVLDQLSRLTRLEPDSPLAGRLDLRHVGIIGHSIGGASAVQVIADDPRFKVGVNLDGRLFGGEPNARLNRPFLWLQSDGAPSPDYTPGRDRFLGRLRDGGALLTIRGGVHIGFTDRPAYLTSAGRSLLGAITGRGSISLADMTRMTADMISAFVGPALGVKHGRSLERALARDPGVRLERLIAPVS